MICPNCGVELASNIKFCHNCGQQIVQQDLSSIPFNQRPDSDTYDSSPESSSVGKKILSIVLGVLLFSFLTGCLASSILKPTNVTSVIKDANLSWISEKLEVTDNIITEVNWLGDSRYPYTRPSQEFLETFGQLDDYDFSSFLKNENVKAEIVKVVDGYKEALINNNWRYSMKAKGVISFLKAISPEIRDVFKYKITSDDYDALEIYLEEFQNINDLNLNTILKDYKYPVITLSSIFPLIIFSLLILMIIFNIFILHIKSSHNFFFNIGVPIVGLGLVFLIFGLVAGPLSFVFDSNLQSTLKYVLAWYPKTALIWGSITLIIGVAILFVNKKINRNFFGNVYIAEWFKGFKAGLVILLTNIIIVSICGILFLTTFTL
jgi:hypothetical protein